jgi:hypothetical protein
MRRIFNDISFLKAQFVSLVLLFVINSWMIFNPVTSDPFWFLVPYVDSAEANGNSFALRQLLDLGLHGQNRPPVAFTLELFTWFFQIQFATFFHVSWASINWVTSSLVIFLALLILSHLLPELWWFRKFEKKNLLVFLTFGFASLAITNSTYFHDSLSVWTLRTWIFTFLPLYAFLLALRAFNNRSQNYVFNLSIFASLVLLLISVNSYEATFPSVILVTFLLIRILTNSRNSIVKIVSGLTILLIYILLINYSMKVFFGEEVNQYAGLVPGANPIRSLLVIFIQLLMTLPYLASARAILENWQQGSAIYNLQLPLPGLSIRSIFLVLIITSLFALIVIYRWKFISKDLAQIQNAKIVSWQIPMLVSICIFPTFVFSLSSKYLREIPLFFASYLGYPLILVLIVILFPLVVSNLLLYKKTIISVVIISVLFASISNFLASEINTKNQRLLIEAEESLVGINPTSEICSSIAGVRSLNYANLGETMANHLAHLVATRIKGFSC